MSRLGIVADPHEPFCHPLYKQFVHDTFDSFQVDTIHFAGDVVDSHALSFWDHDPNGHSAESEAALAESGVAEWYNMFPKATVSIGNHDERHFRAARKAGIPDRFVRQYKDVWKTPKWKWDFEFVVDDVLLEHGTGTSGKDAAINLAIQKRCSIAIGHVHAYAGAKHHTNPFNRVFGMNVGCGIDCKAYAFAYGKAFPVRPVLGCGIVIDGWFPIFVPMLCGDGEKYHRSRSGKKRKR